MLSWQIDGKGCANAHFTVEMNSASSLLDEALHNRETQASALADRLGCKVRIENSGD